MEQDILRSLECWLLTKKVIKYKNKRVCVCVNDQIASEAVNPPSAGFQPSMPWENAGCLQAGAADQAGAPDRSS